MPKKPGELNKGGWACLPCLIMGYQAWLGILRAPEPAENTPEAEAVAKAVAQDFALQGQLLCRTCGRLYQHEETLPLSSTEYAWLSEIFRNRRSNRALNRLLEGLQRDRGVQSG